MAQRDLEWTDVFNQFLYAASSMKIVLLLHKYKKHYHILIFSINLTDDLFFEREWFSKGQEGGGVRPPSKFATLKTF